MICLGTVIENPGIYLKEIKQKIYEETGTDVAESTLCRFLQNSGFTRQKMVTTAKQRNELLRHEFRYDMTVFKGHPELFVFVDETGTDRIDSMRKYAYILHGQPAVTSKLLTRGQRVSAIVGMPCRGILDFHTTTKTVCGSDFLHYVQEALLPHLQPFIMYKH